MLERMRMIFLGFFHKEKRSSLVCDLIWNVSLAWYALDTNVLLTVHAFSVNIGFVVKRNVHKESKGLSESNI